MSGYFKKKADNRPTLVQKEFGRKIQEGSKDRPICYSKLSVPGTSLEATYLVTSVFLNLNTACLFLSEISPARHIFLRGTRWISCSRKSLSIPKEQCFELGKSLELG